jgi:hypothetical protein
VARIYSGKQLLQELRQRKEKEEWLFAIAVVKAGLEREGNWDTSAEKEIAEALAECRITPEEFDEYLKKNRTKLLRFLDRFPPL